MSQSSEPPTDAPESSSSSNSANAAPAPQIYDARSTLRSSSLTQESAPNGTHTQPADSEPSRCFVCLEDEPAGGLSSDWVTPCTCSLAGHQHCLLAWVADVEMQGKDLNELECPMCKSHIRVIDQFDFVLQLNDKLTRSLSRASPYILLTLISSGAIVGSTWYGMLAIQLFAGEEALLHYLYPRQHIGTWVKKLGKLLTKEPVCVSHNFGKYEGMPNVLHIASLPLIGPALIINRMHQAELVMIPTSFLHVMFFNHRKANILAWPPSPSRALAAFPAIRAMYFHAHRMLSRSLDRRLQRFSAKSHDSQGGTAEQVVPRRDNPEVVAADGDEQQHLVELRVELEIPMGEVNEALPDEAAPIRQNRPIDAIDAMSSICNYLVGALMMPMISGLSGMALEVALPKSWVSRPASGRPTGILQERWGRSLVGGCLFVVLKDAFHLYVKYRRAITRPCRRVANNSDERNRTR